MPPSHEELRAAVLSRRDDHDLLRVYADSLSDAGEPLGELIMLQLSRLAGELSANGFERECELLALHGKRWIAPLGEFLRDDFTIDLGFLCSCTIANPKDHRLAADYKPQTTYPIEPIIGHRLWETVEDFEGPPQIYLHPVMRSLRSVASPYGTDRGLIELCAGPVVRPIARLQIDGRLLEEAQQAVRESPSLPQLEELDVALRTIGGVATWSAAPVAKRLGCLVLRFEGLPRPWAELFEQLDTYSEVPLVVLPETRWDFEASYQLLRSETRYDAMRLVIEARGHHGVELRDPNLVVDDLAALAPILRRVDVLVRGFSPELIVRLRSIVNQFAEGTVTAVHDRPMR